MTQMIMIMMMIRLMISDNHTLVSDCGSTMYNGILCFPSLTTWQRVIKMKSLKWAEMFRNKTWNIIMISNTFFMHFLFPIFSHQHICIINVYDKSLAQQRLSAWMNWFSSFFWSGPRGDVEKVRATAPPHLSSPFILAAPLHAEA